MNSSLLNRTSESIDRVNRTISNGVSWLALLMILIGSFNALARYLGRSIGWNLSSNLYLEAQWYLFGVLFLLAAGHALSEDRHVRVDVLYGRLSESRRAWIDAVGAVFLLLPFCLFVVWISWPSVLESWRIRERSPDPDGLVRYPIKALVLLAFSLVALQGVSELIKAVGKLRASTANRGLGATTADRPEGEGS